MAEAHAVELRERVVGAYEAGEGSYADLAERFCIGSASVKRWVRRFRREGHVRPKKEASGRYSDIAIEEVEAIGSVTKKWTGASIRNPASKFLLESSQLR
jgi:transposase